jgi:uncharacterized integral membrane protein (TIGR00698 family)
LGFECTCTVLIMKLSAEAFASLDSMEGIELPRPRSQTPSRAGIWSRLGLLAALCIAAAAWAVHLLFPPVSAAILAIVLGGVIRNSIALPPALIEDCKGLVKRVIPITIVLTGASVNLTEVARVGAPSLAVILAAVICGCGVAVLAGRMITISRNAAMLVGCGTAICGTSAIIASAPIIGADDDDLLLSVSTINILGLVVMFTLPALGAAIHLSQQAFGIWAGVTVHAVPQAITTGFAYSAQSGALATLVKLVRVTLLAPFLIVLALVSSRSSRTRLSWSTLLPRFIWGFLVLALCNTLHLFPDLVFNLPFSSAGKFTPMNAILTQLAEALLTLSMAAMGLEVNLRFLLRTGLAALGVGVAASIAQVLLTLGMIRWLL